MKTSFSRPARASYVTERRPRPSLAHRWACFWLRQQTRRALLRMTDEQLKDVGLTRRQADLEARLPFWQVLR